MDKLIDDLLHAQPDSLFIIFGLLLIAIGVVGSIKTYIDPGKYGRIAALGIGTVLVIIGFVLFSKQPAATTSANDAVVAQGGSRICTFKEGPLTGATHLLPRARLQPIGNPCHDMDGNRGTVVAAGTSLTPAAVEPAATAPLAH
ncbi:MAG: hypothetical protein ABI197_08235 [Granulicella sp.]